MTTEPGWLDVLPWLDTADLTERVRIRELGGERWWLWETPRDSADQRDVDELVDNLVSIMLDHHESAKIGQLVRLDATSVPVAAIPGVRIRAINALHQERIHTLGGLLAMTIGQFGSLRAVGRGTVESTLAALVKHALNPRPPLDSADATATDPSPADEPTAAERSILSDVRAVARWRVLIGEAEVPLLTSGPLDAPSAVLEAHERLLSVTAREVGRHESVASAAATAVSELDTVVVLLNDRQLDVATRRLFAMRPMTLDEVGQVMGVTRERVRQIEAKVRDRLTPSVEFGTGPGDLLVSLRSALTPVAPIDRLVAEHPALGAVVPSLDAPVWLVLDRLDDAFEVRDGWAAAPSYQAAVMTTRAVVEDLDDEFGVAPLGVVRAQALPRLSAQEAEQWLTQVGYEVRGKHVLTRTRGIADLAAASLAIAGEPVGFDELVGMLRVERTRTSIRNALFADDRFGRVDRDRWALSSWGHEGYASIGTLIQRQLDQHGGEIGVAALVASLTDQYSAAPASVRAYASSYPYVVRDGVVRRSTHAVVARKGSFDTRRLFRASSGWRYRVQITNEHLRGSGFQIPVGAASVIGLSRGGSVSMPSRLGNQVANWTTQPTTGSIRRFLLDLGTSNGDDVFLRLADGEFDVLPARTPRHNAGWEHASVLAGLPVPADRPSAFEALAWAVGLDSKASKHDVARRCRERGDLDIAGLLEPPDVVAGVAD